MGPTWITNKLASWAVDLDEKTRLQAEMTSRLDIVHGHVALMPDAHLGIGSTVGSVLATKGAIVPACAGVDLGCGCDLWETDLSLEDLPDDLTGLLSLWAEHLPSMWGSEDFRIRKEAEAWMGKNPNADSLSSEAQERALKQLSSLGSGNHFTELVVDEKGKVSVVVHSGSRGVGNRLAQGHIKTAKLLAKRAEIGLEDPDLAYLIEGTPEFNRYMSDLWWAQAYAFENRRLMAKTATSSLFRFVGKGRVRSKIACHHNYTAKEVHEGHEIWVTRKGAVNAAEGQLALIPGSMGTSTFVVRGLGNPASFHSAAHGAGRAMSRTAAKKTLSQDSLRESMEGITWLEGNSDKLVDEHPDAYKDIHKVMAAQSDLVEVVSELRQVLNYKGV